jgi:hypothetical protein
MYRDPKTGGFTDKFHLYSQVTTTAISLDCDEGTTCTMDKDPVMLGPLVLWPGRATCKPNY